MTGRRPRAAPRRAALGVLAGLFLVPSGLGAGTVCTALELPVRRLEPPPSQYVDFCERHPGDCTLQGADTLVWTPALAALLASVNLAVNTEVRFMSDPDYWGMEEYWSYPEKGYGDCEDYALEKRCRLIAEGLPSAALTIAIVHHVEEFFPHAILLVETGAGTFALDNLHPEPMCWSDLPYRWERRERPDGQWTRFERQ